MFLSRQRAVSPSLSSGLVFRGVVHEKARIEVSQPEDADCSTASAS